MKHIKLFEHFRLKDQSKFKDFEDGLHSIGAALSNSEGTVGKELSSMVIAVGNMIINNPEKLNQAAERMAPLSPRIAELAKLGFIDDFEQLRPLEIDENGYHMLHSLIFALLDRTQLLSLNMNIPENTLELLGSVLWMILCSVHDRKIMDRIKLSLGVE
jgi:hypothetical protein